jgi:hypothetical protein
VNTGTPTDCASLGNTENEYAAMAISPNPFTTTTVITADRELNNAQLLVYNPLGQLVRQVKNIHENELVFSRDNLESGIYFLQLIEEGKLVASRKLIIAD